MYGGLSALLFQRKKLFEPDGSFDRNRPTVHVVSSFQSPASGVSPGAPMPETEIGRASCRERVCYAV